MGLFSRNKPKIKITSTKKDGFSGWLKCTSCSELIHAKELEENNHCCPKCDYHYRLGAEERIRLLVDPNSFSALFQELEAVDALGFVDTLPYKARLESARAKGGKHDACIVGTCLIDNVAVALGVMDFSFMGGSMGSVVGEKLTLLIEHAIDNLLPVIIISISGGARMQESTLSLMQMAKTSAALARLQEKQLAYISVLTNPTTGGVTASFASLGDIIIAEPQALVCFAGPRVIEQTLGKPLPPGAQQSEFLLKNGLIDLIVSRHDLRSTLGNILHFVTQNKTTSFTSLPPTNETT